MTRDEDHAALMAECRRLSKEVERLAAMVPSWTSDRPTVEGYYWLRCDETPKPYIVEFVVLDGVLQSGVWGTPADSSMFDRVLFAGPLQHPSIDGAPEATQKARESCR